jgi:single-strand DNA-binding protein
MNRVIITGNLGADPELRQTASGMAVANLSVATNERIKKGDTWEDHTEWHRVVVFGSQATTCDKFLSKGSKVAVEGKIRTRDYKDRTGQDRRSTEILADRVEFMDRRANNTVNAAPSAPPAQPSPHDDIPF